MICHGPSVSYFSSDSRTLLKTHFAKLKLTLDRFRSFFDFFDFDRLSIGERDLDLETRFDFFDFFDLLAGNGDSLESLK